MRLNKLLALKLGISRRAADKLITNNRITVDNLPARLGVDVSSQHIVCVDDKPLPDNPAREYLMLNKPVGYVCSRRGQGSQTIYDLLPGKYHHLKTVGRLDKDSSGLLLLTNDGQLNFALTHPSKLHEKVYQVKLDRPIELSDTKIIRSGGVTLNDGVSRFLIKKTANDYLEIRLHEGRNRQIRRTFEAIGYRITSLHRIQVGPYKLQQLPLGQYKLINRAICQ